MDPNPSPSPLVPSLLNPLPTSGAYGFESYLATGIGLSPELEALAPGGPVGAGISEGQITAWMAGAGSGGGLDITGFSGGGGVFLPLNNPLAATSLGTANPCRDPLPPAVPNDDPEKSNRPTKEKISVPVDINKATGQFVVSSDTQQCKAESGSGNNSPIHWSNNTAAVSSINAGPGWSYSELPRLVLRQADTAGARSITLPFSGTDTRTFQRSSLDPSLFQRTVGDGPTDYIQRIGNELHYKNADGETIRFADFSSSTPAAIRGQFLGSSDAAGNRIDATLNANGTIAARTGFQAGSATPDKIQTFVYNTSGPDAGRLQTITSTRPDGTILRRTEFSYYSAGSPYGKSGDLKGLVVRDGSGAILDRSAFRYSTDSRGRSLLNYAFAFDDTQRIAAAGLNLDTATNAQLAPYAQHAFFYDTQNRLTRFDNQADGGAGTGGIGTHLYSYSTNPGSSTGFNSWRYKNVEISPDGNETISYMNTYGQEMLTVRRVVSDPSNPALVGKQWGTFTAFDETTGLAVLQATPESVQLPGSLSTLEVYNDLLHKVGGNYQYLADSTGAITRSTYGTSSTASESSAGDVRGFVKDVVLTRGETGTAVPQLGFQYFTRSVSLGGVSKTVNPLASLTSFRNDDGTGAQVTKYSYDWYANSTQTSMITTTLPVVGAGQNGPGTAAMFSRAFDRVGREIWSRDEDGFLTFTAYDTESGSILKHIEDVNTSLTGSFTGLPTGWSTPSGGGLHLTTSYAVDRLGREIRETDPNGNVHVTVYDDVSHSERRYTGWNSGTGLATGPTEVIREDLSGTYFEILTMSATPTSSGGLPNGSEPISNVESLSRSYLNAAGQVVNRDDYFNLSGITWSTAANLGAENVNFYRTRFGYNNQGLVDREQAPTGTITLSKYDGLERLSSEWIGTDMSNISKVASYLYDGNNVGNGSLTRLETLPLIGDTRVSQFAYDWRDRVVAGKAGVEVIEEENVNRLITYHTLNNLNQVTSRSQFDGDGIDINTDADGDGTPDAPDPADRRRFSRIFTDNQGRQFRGQNYLVDQSTGVVYDVKQQSDNWFDKRGNWIQTAVSNGPASQYRTDGAGRITQSFTLGNVPNGSWADAYSLSNSVVLEQQDSSYDANSNLIQTTIRQRFHNASPTATGALGTASSGIRARVSTSTAYYDAADRLTASVDLGTNGGSPYIRPATPPAPSDVALVSSYSYDSAGRLKDVTDPRGLVARTLYDALGRRTRTIANATGGAPGTSTDVTTNYTYDGNSNLLTLEAVQPAGTPSQITRFLYEARTATGSAINSNDLLTGKQFPDKVSGTPSAGEQETYLVNALGDRIRFTDRNGTVHSYGYDVVGRQLSDVVSTIGTNIDGTVRRIEVAYDGAGLAAEFTSYGAVSGGSVVNQVGRVFNGFGQLTIELQSHTGAIDLASTPKVSYGYSLTNGGNHSRPTSLSYPDGFVVGYGYDSGIDNAISRLSRVTEGSGGLTLESFHFLGLGTVVERARPQVGITLSLVSHDGSIGSAGDQYTGLDRFGRLVDQRWFSGSGAGAVDVDRYGYTYDRNSNRLTRSNLVNGDFSEVYTYDGLNQLQTFNRAGTVAPSNQQWTFDALGNWTTLTTDGVPENRTANAQNQYTDVGGTALAYSANGNLTTDQEGRTLIYDAWNRLISVKNSGGTLLARYGYDGLNHRITEQVGTDAVPNAAMAAIRDLFYSADWQVLEERVRTGGVIPATADTRYVWSPVYVDAMVLRDSNADGNSSTGPGGLEERIYVLQDGNWNTTTLIAGANVPGKASGEVIHRLTYTPYGKATFLTANWAMEATPSDQYWEYQFQGLKINGATGLAYSRNRDYSPTLGRFIILDPVGFEAGDINLYRFVGNNPVVWSDPSGLIVETAWDLINVGMGAYSLYDNIKGGKWGWAAIDAIGLIYDSAAAVVPVLPAGASAYLKATRAGISSGVKIYKAGQSGHKLADSYNAGKDIAKIVKQTDKIARKLPDGALPKGQAQKLGKELHDKLHETPGMSKSYESRFKVKNNKEPNPDMSWKNMKDVVGDVTTQGALKSHKKKYDKMRTFIPVVYERGKGVVNFTPLKPASGAAAVIFVGRKAGQQPPTRALQQDSYYLC